MSVDFPKESVTAQRGPRLSPEQYEHYLNCIVNRSRIILATGADLLGELIEKRVPASQLALNHPTIQVRTGVGPAVVGFLGLLGWFVGTTPDGRNAICAVYDRNDNDRLVALRRTDGKEPTSDAYDAIPLGVWRGFLMELCYVQPDLEDVIMGKLAYQRLVENLLLSPLRWGQLPAPELTSTDTA